MNDPAVLALEDGTVWRGSALGARGTAAWLRRVGLRVETLNKVSEGSPHVVEAMAHGHIQLVVNTPLGRQAYGDGEEIRRAAVRCKTPLLTTLSATAAAIGAIRALQQRDLRVKSLQEHHLGKGAR
jgi:carbamoyl-phosphate synthase large subunit